jgi:hypothetical protein
MEALAELVHAGVVADETMVWAEARPFPTPPAAQRRPSIARPRQNAVRFAWLQER